MDRMHPFDTRRPEPAPCDEVDADRQDLVSGVEINAPDIPRFGNTERRFKQLVLHARAVASKPECSTMPHSAWLDCMVPRSPSRVRCAGLPPALDRAHRTLLSSPNPLEFQKRHFFDSEVIALPCTQEIRKYGLHKKYVRPPNLYLGPWL